MKPSKVARVLKDTTNDQDLSDAHMPQDQEWDSHLQEDLVPQECDEDCMAFLLHRANIANPR